MNSRIYSFTQTNRLVGVVSILLLGLLLTGCGKKAFPKPAAPEPPPQVRDLHGQVRSKGVELSWTLPERMKAPAREEAYRFSIQRSELKWENRNCLDCPAPTQQEIQNIDPAAPSPAFLDGNKLVWMDTAVSQQHAYRYQIAVEDAKKRVATSSNPVAVKVVSPPAGVKNLTAKAEPKGILLNWKAPSKDEHGQAFQGDLSYNVERQPSNGPWEKISSIPVKGNSFLDPAVAANQTYNYRVTPYLLFEETAVLGEPAVSNQVKGPEALPPPPPDKVWVIPSKGFMEVHWTESEGRPAGYHVYRREGKEIIRLTANPIQRAPYVDRSARKGVVYSYAVSAVSNQPDHREGLLSKWAEIRGLLFE